MKPAVLIAVVGAAAAFFAVILNLAPGADVATSRTLAFQTVIAGLIAIGCGIACVRRGGLWRWTALAIGGPALFALADAGMRLALFLK